MLTRKQAGGKVATSPGSNPSHEGRKSNDPADSIDTTSTTSDIDLYNLTEYFCETPGKIEQIGPCRRLVFVNHETAGARRNRVGVVKLVLPADALVEVAQMLAADIHVPRAMASLSPSALAN
jgi:hypothetical protein